MMLAQGHFPFAAGFLLLLFSLWLVDVPAHSLWQAGSRLSPFKVWGIEQVQQ
jgi:hypothetical protein